MGYVVIDHFEGKRGRWSPWSCPVITFFQLGSAERGEPGTPWTENALERRRERERLAGMEPCVTSASTRASLP